LKFWGEVIIGVHLGILVQVTGTWAPLTKTILAQVFSGN